MSICGALTPNSKTTYAAGILHFNQFCNKYNIDDEDCMPASYALLCPFIAEYKGRQSRSTIKGWLSGIRSFHLVNHAPWHGDDKWVQFAHTLYLLKMKDKVPWAYKQYEVWVETQMGKKIKVLNSDRGGEYQGADFVEYLKSKSTIQSSMYMTCPNTQELPNAGTEPLANVYTLFSMQVVFLNSYGERRLIMLFGC